MLSRIPLFHILLLLSIGVGPIAHILLHYYPFSGPPAVGLTASTRSGICRMPAYGGAEGGETAYFQY